MIGDVNAIHVSLFQPGSTLAERIANQFQGALNSLHDRRRCSTPA